jgi:hypothetical protein
MPKKIKFSTTLNYWDLPRDTKIKMGFESDDSCPKLRGEEE